MKRFQSRYLVAALSAVVLASVGVSHAGAIDRVQPFAASQPQQYVLETQHGSLFLEVVHPTKGGEIVPAPVVLTTSPYSALGRNADAGEWVASGYARAWADALGTSNSGGCFDYGGVRDQESGFELVEWIAKQEWSKGRVAMIGGSYDGALAVATAITKPPHLATIVPQLAVTSWYHYGYSGGIRYAFNNEKLGRQGPTNGLILNEQSFGTPLGFDAGLALPPPVDVTGSGWQDRVASSITPGDELQHVQEAYDLETPDFTEFWATRDYVPEAKRLDIPVLVTGAWGDWNVKQEHSVRLFESLPRATGSRLYMAGRWTGHTLPGGEYGKLLHQWVDLHLKGKGEASTIPTVTSRLADYDGERGWYRGDVPKTKGLVLYPQQAIRMSTNDYDWKLLPDAARPNPIFPTTPASFPSAGANTETHANHHGRANHDWFWFESPPLEKDLRVFGTIQLEVRTSADREWVTLTPGVVDIDHERHQTIANQHVATCKTGDSPQDCTSAVVSVTRGWLDSRYRGGLAQAVPVDLNQGASMTIAAKPVDYVFKKGHSIGLAIQTEISEWSLPKVYPCQTPECATVRIHWENGETKLRIPVVGSFGSPEALFESAGHGH